MFSILLHDIGIDVSKWKLLLGKSQFNVSFLFYSSYKFEQLGGGRVDALHFNWYFSTFKNS